MKDYLIARERPLGIILLTILHSVGGIGLAIVILASVFTGIDADAMDALRSVGIPFPFVVVGVCFLSVLGIASAIGMW
jgi:hypothetical protein